MSTTKSNAIAFVTGVGLLLTMGCAQKKKVEEIWDPPPRVAWSDLVDREVDHLTNGYVRMDLRSSLGRFPASVAVTRIAVSEDVGLTGGRRVFLPPRPKNEFLMWNSAFDDQMAISEVFPISDRDLGGGAAEPRQIIAAFSALKAKLGLVYATNYISETQTEMIGVLYESGSVDPVAVFHAEAASITPPEDEKEPIDLWEFDSRALVREKFKGLVYACLRELIHSDQPERVDVPEGWLPEYSEVPVEWPPRHVRGR